MTLQGRVSNLNDPMTISTRGMLTQMQILNIHTDNVAYADIPGYQRKEPVMTSFIETLGFNGVGKVTNTEVGRIHYTGKPLDFAINTLGYFQKQMPDGRVEMTRDGRFRLDKTGRLLSDDLMPILSTQGRPIQLPVIPEQLEHIKVSSDGWIEVIDPKAKTSERVAQLSIVSEDGSVLDKVDVRQKHVEQSNVFLFEEYVSMAPLRRNFQANKAVFQTQNQALQRLLQELGRAQ